MAVCKPAQRKLYDILSHRIALILLISLALSTILLVFLEIGEIWFFWSRHPSQKASIYDDGTKNDKICGSYGEMLPIDAVYTWTNYSDPLLQEKWQKLIAQSEKGDFSTICPEESCMTSHIVAYRACNVGESKIRAEEPLLPVDALHGGTCNNQTLVLVELDSALMAIGASKLDLLFEGRNLTTSVRRTFWTTNLNDPRHIMTPNRVRLCGLSVEILSLENDKLLKYLHKLLKIIVLDARAYPNLQCAIIRLSSVKSVDHVIVSKELAAADIFPQRVSLGLYTIEDTNNRVPQDFNFEGLRYSLRSLERHAPWIRHVYLVTNGEIPYWLDLNNKRVSVVGHSEIFPDSKRLPTFNGAAVDSHIHRIKGLSTHYLYLSESIIFGKDVWPEDFYSNSHGYKLYKAWRAPECSPACRWPWIGDGSCDEECDEPECGFDGGDCEIIDDPKNFNNNRHQQAPTNLSGKTKKSATKPTPHEASITHAIIKNPSSSRIQNGVVVLEEYKDEMNKQDSLASDSETVYVLTQFPSFSRAKLGSPGDSYQSLPNAGALWVEPGHAMADDQRPHVTSLRYMNLLLSKELGFASQWIPAPTPILFNKGIVSSMIKRFEDQWRATSERRWDSSLNLHFVFMYFAFLIGEYVDVSFEQIFDDFDTDRSGSWSDRELRVLMARSQQGPLTEDIITWFERTILSCTQTSAYEPPKTSRSASPIMPERYEDSPLPVVTKSLILECEPFREKVLSQLSRRPRYDHEVLDHWGRETAFVVTGNISVLVAHLDDIRLSPRKFIHVQKRAWAGIDSETVRERSVEEAVLQDMMYSLLPEASALELPADTCNKWMTLDEVIYHQDQNRRATLKRRLFVVALLLIPLTAWWHTAMISICRRVLSLLCCCCLLMRARRRQANILNDTITVI